MNSKTLADLKEASSDIEEFHRTGSKTFDLKFDNSYSASKFEIAFTRLVSGAETEAEAEDETAVQNLTARQRNIINFLLGDDLLDGLEFGQPNPVVSMGMYWWRTELRKAFK